MDSMITGIQIRGARAMLRWSTVVLAKRSNVLRATILQAESVDGFPHVDAKNLLAIKAALSAGGVGFIDGALPGVRMKAPELGTIPLDQVNAVNDETEM
jgi:hypothetical protein